MAACIRLTAIFSSSATSSGNSSAPALAAVRLQQIRHEIDVRTVAEAVGRVLRHRGAQVLHHLVRALPGESRQESAPDERRRHIVTLQRIEMAGSTRALIHLLAALHLLLGEDAIPDRPAARR